MKLATIAIILGGVIIGVDGIGGTAFALMGGDGAQAAMAVGRAVIFGGLLIWWGTRRYHRAKAVAGRRDQGQQGG